MLHYLDDLRHALATMWTYDAWAGNISAAVITFVAATVAWPRTRRVIIRFLGQAIHAHLAPHLEALHHHIEQATGIAHDPSWRAGKVVAGVVGSYLHESHEPRLLLTTLAAAGAPSPVSGFQPFDVAGSIASWGMDNNGPDPSNPPQAPNGLGCCGFAAVDHANVAKLGDATQAGTSMFPKFQTLYDAYWAYGRAMGEPGQYPDLGVSNSAMLGWLYSQGLIDGYAEVPKEFAWWAAQQFSGVICGSILTAQAQDDFNQEPRIPWGSPGETTDPQLGHDWLLVKGTPDGGGQLVTWGALQPFTPEFWQANVTDCWVIFDKDDPFPNWATLEAVLTELHGQVTPPANA